MKLLPYTFIHIYVTHIGTYFSFYGKCIWMLLPLACNGNIVFCVYKSFQAPLYQLENLQPQQQQSLLFYALLFRYIFETCILPSKFPIYIITTANIHYTHNLNKSHIFLIFSTFFSLRSPAHILWKSNL